MRLLLADLLTLLHEIGCARFLVLRHGRRGCEWFRCDSAWVPSMSTRWDDSQSKGKAVGVDEVSADRCTFTKCWVSASSAGFLEVGSVDKEDAATLHIHMGEAPSSRRAPSLGARQDAPGGALRSSNTTASLTRLSASPYLPTPIRFAVAAVRSHPLPSPPLRDPRLSASRE